MSLMTPCIEWPGPYLGKNKYGRLPHRRPTDGSEWLVHRIEWMKHHGPIPEGLIVRHRCDNPPCYRIDHLELGTKADNSDDMVERNRNSRRQAEKTECPQGHQYSPENTYVYQRVNPKNGHAYTTRRCRICTLEKYRRLHPDSQQRKP